MKTQLLPWKIEIQGEIAKGQTGTIYYGYDLELRQEMAIKVYHTHINGRLIRGKAFIEKAKSLLRLEHPNLIKLFKVEEQDGTPVVCMEFFDAPSLQHVIQNEGPLSVEKMLLLAREIAEVLVHIHFQGQFGIRWTGIGRPVISNLHVGKWVALRPFAHSSSIW